MEFNATFFVSAISFILFTIILNKIFCTPIGNIIAEREKFIDSALKSAKEAETKAKDLLDERSAKLEDASKKCKEIISKNVEKANLKAKSDTDNARLEIVEQIEKGKKDIAQQGTAAEKQLKSSVKEIANIISEKILG